MDMRIVKFCLSMWLVQIKLLSGLPMTGTFSACVTSGGLYRCSSLDSAYTLVSWAKSQRSGSVVSDCRNVRLESGGRDLKPLAGSCGAKPFDKGVRIGLRATAQSEVGNELGIPLHGQ